MKRIIATMLLLILSLLTLVVSASAEVPQIQTVQIGEYTFDIP